MTPAGRPAGPPAAPAHAAPGIPAEPPAPGGPARGAGRRAGWPALARVAAPAAAAAAMAAAGLWGLARDSAMGNDEVATRWAAGLPLRQLALLLRHVDAVHGLYYLLVHAWLAVGSSPAVLRIPSVLAMTAAAALLVILGRRLTGSAAAGLLAGLIMAMTPVITYYAQTARSYALVFACVLAATLALLRALDSEERGTRVAFSWLGYGALLTLAGYLNEMALLVIAAHAVTIALARPGRTAATRWFAAAGSAAVLVTPLVILSDREAGAVTWIDPPDAHDLLVLFHDYFGATTAAAVLVAACAVLALLPGRRGRGPAATRTSPATSATPSPAQPRPARSAVTLVPAAVPLLLVPAALLLLESAVAHPLYADRYVLYGEAGAALLAGAGTARACRWLARVLTRKPDQEAALPSGGDARVPAGQDAGVSSGHATGALSGQGAGPNAGPRDGQDLRPRAGRAAGAQAASWALGAVLIAAALALQLGPAHGVRTPGSRLFDFGGPSHYIGAHARPGDGILYFGRFFRKAELGYPADYRDTRDFSLAVSPARSGSFQGTGKPAGAAVALMPRFRRIWVVGRAPSPTLPPGPAVPESRVLLTQFRLIARQHFRGIVVTLWQRAVAHVQLTPGRVKRQRPLIRSQQFG
ncbi:MAG TPA: glycosyltransferase family 39 protein [Streptosporangiaceae bacterium]|nr:glycosyltransferase family 39 protein [Streptosporangiaceae bacterium]